MRDISIVAQERQDARFSGNLLLAAAIGGPVALFALQAVAAGRLELTFDEAYYTLWSRSLAFGYLDHPPMVALLIRGSTALFGGSELGVRALSLLLVAVLPALIALVAWRLFRSAETAALVVLMWIGMPLAMAGAVFVTPDTPLVVFWTLGLAALVELWRTGKARWLLAIGVALGLMLQSKFTAAFFAAGVALAFLTAPSMRRWLLSPVSAAALFIAAVIFAPFVAWNAEHGFATFFKQLGRAPPHGFEPFYLLEFVASQILLMNPLVFAPFAGAVAAARWRLSIADGSAEEARRILVSTIAPAAIYFSLHALHDRVQGNWLAPLFPACAVLAADWVAGVRRAGAGGWKGAVAKASLWAAPLGLAFMILGFVQTETGFLPLGAADPTARLEGFRDLASELDARAKAEGAQYVLTQGYALDVSHARLWRSVDRGRPAGAAHPLDFRALAAREPVRRAGPRARRNAAGATISSSGCGTAQCNLRARSYAAAPDGRSRPTPSTASPILTRPCSIRRARARRSTFFAIAGPEGAGALIRVARRPRRGR